MTDARRITVGPIAAAYLEIQQGVVLVLATDFDALHAEAEAMRVVLHEIASANPAERGIEWAKSYASDGLKGAGSELYARWLDTFKEAEALRAESQHWKNMHARSMAMRMSVEFERDEMREQLEEARVLLRHASSAMAREGMESALVYEIDTFLTATPAPEAPDHIAEASKMAEQGERQEAACWVPRACLDKLRNGRNNSPTVLTDGPAEFNDTPLYTTPQPSQDVRGLAAAMYQACGAYDMPERILDALSAAANGEPFTHMIDGLLPCVPPSELDVRGLVEALEECAASLAWNCFGECRAVHAGPIMPAAKALDTARTALAANRQAQRPA